MTQTRTEQDSLGTIQVPSDALYGAQTARAVDNFRIGGGPLDRRFIAAIARIKLCAANANRELDLLDSKRADAIAGAAREIIAGQHPEQFPVDMYQTGSGTSSNMNLNEVIAHIASSHSGEAIHPNDHVNLCQSSNDVIPAALQLAAVTALRAELLPSLEGLIDTLEQQAERFSDVVKTGRTHLMDAMPIRLDQELSGWRQQLVNARERLYDAEAHLLELPLGGTAVGTGVNAHPQYPERVVALLATETGLALKVARNHFERLSSQDCAVALSGQLRTLAVALIKISNDLRWMNSGPNAGLGEIELQALQPGSSIMPGKVNPVIPEAVAQAATQCLGLDAAVAIAGQSGNFQLNVMLPLIGQNLLQMLALLSGSCEALASRAITGFTVKREHLAATVARNPILVTALNPVIGYEKAAEIAKQAMLEQRPVLEVAREVCDLDEATLRRLLDPRRLTDGGMPDAD